MARILLSTALAITGATQAHAVCYVNQTATGKNDGLSWTDAFTDLQSALAKVGCDEVWVAKGVYRPSKTDIHASFAVLPRTALYGGFSGTESSVGGRDITANETVLSGDIDDDDLRDPGSAIDTDASQIVGDNSLNVVILDGTAVPITDSTVLDGFTITAGNARSASGGGLYCNGAGVGSECSPLLNNMVFAGNSANGANGGALYIDCNSGGKSNLKLSNVSFSGNYAFEGGAIFTETGYDGSLRLQMEDVTMQRNIAEHRGGAIYNDAYEGNDTEISADKTYFSNNRSTASGGAIFGQAMHAGTYVLNFARSTFNSNEANYGGAIYAESSEAQIITNFSNTSFIKNGANIYGGAIALTSEGGTIDSLNSIKNVTFFGNHADGDSTSPGQGGAIDIYSDHLSGHANNVLDISNSIFWSDTASSFIDGPEVRAEDAAVTIIHSVVDNGCPVAVLCSEVANSDPLLGPVGYYGGSIPVMRPGIGGAAVDNGDDATCESIDQRGFSRPQGKHCDIGAIELRQPSDDLTYPGGFLRWYGVATSRRTLQTVDNH